ncbi:MAG: peptidylprolyl isomerase, partial [Pseudomonadota bacterium]
MANTAYSLAVQTASKPLDTDFGWAIIHVDKITPAVVQTLDDVADLLRQDLRFAAAADVAFDVSQQLDDRLGGGATLEDAAKDLGLPLVISPLINASGASQSPNEIFLLPENTQVLRQAFLLGEGEQSLLLEGPNSVYDVVEVVEIVPSAIPDAAMINDILQADWMVAEQERLSMQDAQELIANAQSGVAFD